MTKTFAEHCQLAQQLLPDAQYRAMLTKLHAEMLEALSKDVPEVGFGNMAEQPAQQEPVGTVRELFTQAAWEKLDVRGSTKVYLAATPQAQQEPVAWGIVASNTGRICQVALDADEVEGHNPKHIVPLYTTPQAPPAREPLTDEEIFDLAEPFGAFEYGDAQGHKRLAFARDIEAAHGITKGNT